VLYIRNDERVRETSLLYGNGMLPPVIAMVSTLSQSSVVTSRVEGPFAVGLNLSGWQEGRPLTQQRDARDLDGVTPRQLPSNTYSPFSQSTCVQDSPQALACPVVEHSELTKVIGLLALPVGVVLTTPELTIWRRLSCRTDFCLCSR